MRFMISPGEDGVPVTKFHFAGSEGHSSGVGVGSRVEVGAGSISTGQSCGHRLSFLRLLPQRESQKNDQRRHNKQRHLDEKAGLSTAADICRIGQKVSQLIQTYILL